jgi:hypothetical protein
MMTTSSITNTDKTDQLRTLSRDEIDAVAGGTVGELQCFPIFEDDGHGGIIMISPTLGPLGRFLR